MPPTTLTRADVLKHVEALTLLEEFRVALISGAGSSSADEASHRQATHPAIPARSVTLHSEGRAMLHLHDATSGELLAVIEAEPLFTLRSSLVAALAADALAPPEAKKVAVLGGGLRGSGVLKALRLVRSLREVWLVAADYSEAIGEAMLLQQTLKTPVRPVERAIEAVAGADLVVLAGGVTLPEVALWPSVPLCVMNGADFEKSPLTPGLLARTWKISEVPGEFWGAPMQAQLGAILAGTAARPTGLNPLFIGGGPAWLDLVAAWHVYQGAQHALTQQEA